MSLCKSVFIVVCLCFLSVAVSIDIKKNAYSGISISFSDQVKEQHFNFEKLKLVLEKSSEYLHHATRRRAYFGNFVIILPSTWTNDICTTITTESPKEVDIYINTETSSVLKTQHSKGCGQVGDMIYMSLNWLNGDTEDLARQFVKQWSIYRYGVFEETSLKNSGCYFSPAKYWSPVGCYDKKITSQPEFSEDGLPNCSVPDEFPIQEIKSSLMSMSNFSKALDFCDGSAEFPHNPAMPTLHNNLCEGKTVWSIIENSDDFKHGKNLPSTSSKPFFKCFQEQAIQITFAIQNSSTNDITLAVQEMRYSLFHFFKNLQPGSAKINLVTFSDSSDNNDPVELNLKDDKTLFDMLDKYVETTRKVNDTCLLCGFQKALKVTQSGSDPAPIAVIIAWESAIIGGNLPEIIEAIQFQPKVQVHLILVEDTEADVIPTDLVHALRSTGGFIHSLPKPYLTADRSVPNVLMYRQLNAVLSTVVKSLLQVDDKIVVMHEATYRNTAGIVDTFSTPSATTGRLVYIMHCDLKGQISNRDPNCTLWDALSNTYKCGSVWELTNEKSRSWTYKFDIRSGVNSPVCASTALLFKSSSSAESTSLRGWFNEYVIIPGENALIIYAEITGLWKQQIIQVLAHISGPGTGNEFEIELRDNGNGDPDVKMGDGIYSRYFTSFKEKGTYVVRVSAKVTTAEASLQKNEESTNPEIVHRKIIGSFTVTNKPSEIDIMPPSRVADLRIAAINHDNSTVTLQWTAPGDDYDYGSAMKYEIKSATSPADLMDLYFNTQDALTQEMKIPQNSGKLETYKFTFTKSHQDVTYFVALRPIDAHNNRGKISNVIQIFIKQKDTTITEPYTTSTSSSATEAESSTQDTNGTSTQTITQSSTTPEVNTTVIAEDYKQDIFDTKFIIVIASAGGVLLLLIIINIIVWCCCFKKRKSTQKPKEDLARKESLRPPHNLNIAYQQESQSIAPSETDISMTVSILDDTTLYSPDPTSGARRSNPAYSYHTSRSILNKSKSQTDSELGFKLVEAMPAYASRSLSRFARRLNDADVESERQSSIAQPQQPKNSNETLMYSLGVV